MSLKRWHIHWCGDAPACGTEEERIDGEWVRYEDLDALTKQLEAMSSPTLPKLLAALGWQGGTVEQALAEVRRLKDLESPMVEMGHVDLLGSVVWKDFAGIDAYKKIGLKVYAISRDKPLGQGVAALLPEHGEVKK